MEDKFKFNVVEDLVQKPIEHVPLWLFQKSSR
jgi:hypothetical protein